MMKYGPKKRSLTGPTSGRSFDSPAVGFVWYSVANDQAFLDPWMMISQFLDWRYQQTLKTSSIIINQVWYSSSMTQKYFKYNQIHIYVYIYQMYIHIIKYIYIYVYIIYTYTYIYIYIHIYIYVWISAPKDPVMVPLCGTAKRLAANSLRSGRTARACWRCGHSRHFWGIYKIRISIYIYISIGQIYINIHTILEYLCIYI